MGGWVTVRHTGHGGVTQIRDLPRVVASYRRRGWEPAPDGPEQQVAGQAVESPAEQPASGDDEVASTPRRSVRHRRSE